MTRGAALVSVLALLPYLAQWVNAQGAPLDANSTPAEVSPHEMAVELTGQ